MTPEDVERWADEADPRCTLCGEAALQRFAALAYAAGQAAEREECAKVCEAQDDPPEFMGYIAGAGPQGSDFARFIRERSKGKA